MKYGSHLQPTTQITLQFYNKRAIHFCVITDHQRVTNCTS